jgi:hypothetical protein
MSGYDSVKHPVKGKVWEEAGQLVSRVGSVVSTTSSARECCEGQCTFIEEASMVTIRARWHVAGCCVAVSGLTDGKV